VPQPVEASSESFWIDTAQLRRELVVSGGVDDGRKGVCDESLGFWFFGPRLVESGKGERELQPSTAACPIRPESRSSRYASSVALEAEHLAGLFHLSQTIEDWEMSSKGHTKRHCIHRPTIASTSKQTKLTSKKIESQKPSRVSIVSAQ